MVPSRHLLRGAQVNTEIFRKYSLSSDVLNTGMTANHLNVMLCLCKLGGFIVGVESYSFLNHIGG